jgi:MYXO-CTERM domain-containing protein
MRILTIVALLAPASAFAADWLQCAQTELMKPDCTAVTVNHVPLHFTASCNECSGGGADIKCSPGELATTATLAVDDAATSTPVAGSIAQASTCAFGVPLWKFSGTLVKGKTYNIVINAAGHKKTLLLAFTAGQSGGPLADIGVPPPDDGGGGKKDSGGVSNTDGGGSSADGGGSAKGDGAGGSGGTTDDGCSCRVTEEPPAAGVFLLLLLLPFVVRRQRRN